jgi:hypothetical protein
LLADKAALAEATTFVAHDKKNSNSENTNCKKSAKNSADRSKQKFPWNKCKQLGHWAAGCPQKQRAADSANGDSASKLKANAFVAHALGASVASISADSWWCDSGASQHITPRKQYFGPYTKFPVPEPAALGKRNVLMQAYGKGAIKIQVFFITGRGTMHYWKTSGMYPMKGRIYIPSKQQHKRSTA